MKTQIILLLSMVLMGCQTNKYLTEQNYAIAKSHKKVAILPVELHTTGNLPDNLTLSEIEKINQAESEFFQDIIMASILNQNKTRNPYFVTFISNEYTNSILAENGITVQNFGNYTPKELADLLGVDGVIASKVKKQRFMSEIASSIIHAAEEIFNAIHKNSILLPWNANRTFEVDLKLTVIDAKTGTVIYNRRVDKSIDFRNDSDDAVEDLAKAIAKKFPYRNYKK